MEALKKYFEGIKMDLSFLTNCLYIIYLYLYSIVISMELTVMNEILYAKNMMFTSFTDWGPKIDVVGFCFLDLASNYKPPEPLLKWIESGEKPIYIGFGSLVSLAYLLCFFFLLCP